MKRTNITVYPIILVIGLSFCKKVTEPATEVKPVVQLEMVPESGKKYATTAVKMRARPDIASEHIGTVPSGSEIEILARSREWVSVGGPNNQWLKAQHNGKTGYVFGEFFTDNKPADLSKYESTINLSRFNGSYDQVISSGEQQTCRPDKLFIVQNLVILHDQCGADSRGLYCLVSTESAGTYQCNQEYTIDPYFLEKYQLSPSIPKESSIRANFKIGSVEIDGRKFTK